MIVRFPGFSGSHAAVVVITVSHCFSWYSYCVALSLTVYLQEITISALPAVRKITVRQLGEMDQNNCNISLNISNEAILLMPESSDNDIAELLNGLQSIQRIGRVIVQKVDNRNVTGMITFTVIFLTRFGTAESDIPAITVNPTPTSCGNTSQTVEIELVQEITVPESFKVGFNDSNRQQRFTSSLPLNVSAGEMEVEITNLFAWQCETICSQGTELYNDTYEISSESTRDNTTSFCGRYSLKNPGTIWPGENNEDSTIEVGTNGYVSVFDVNSLACNWLILSKM